MSKLDLSALKNFSSLMEKGKKEVNEAMESNHGVLLLSLDDVELDPDQPRKEIDPEKLRSFSERIKARGVKTPISVQPKNERGKYVINAGERRYRASKMAGKTHIPAHIDRDFDDYDQVSENRDRVDLTPMEYAFFIQKRVDKGDKKVDIAKKLGMSPSDISFHLALLSLPESVAKLYSLGTCRSPQLLSQLSTLYKKSPEFVDAFCNDSGDVTRSTIERLVEQIEQYMQRLKNEEAPEKVPSPTISSDESKNDAKDRKSGHELKETPESEAKVQQAPVTSGKDVMQEHVETKASEASKKAMRKGVKVSHEDDVGVLVIDEGSKDGKCCIDVNGKRKWVSMNNLRLLEVGEIA